MATAEAKRDALKKKRQQKLSQRRKLKSLRGPNESRERGERRKRKRSVRHRNTSRWSTIGFDTPAIRAEAADLLELGLNEYQVKLNTLLLNRVSNQFHEWLAEEQTELNFQLAHVRRREREEWLHQRLNIDRRRPKNQAPRHLVNFLFKFTQELLGKLNKLKKDNQQFRKSAARIQNETDRQQLILSYAQTLGASDAELKKDEQAFARWFDEEAVTDRFTKQLGELELLTAFAFERLGYLIGYTIRISVRHHATEEEPQLTLAQRITQLWERIDFQARIHSAMVYEGDARLHVSALKGLALALSQVPTGMAADLLDTKTLMFIHRLALESNSDVWLQCEALNILATISVEHALPILKMRLTGGSDNVDDIFVRRHVLKLLELHQLESYSPTDDMVSSVHDESPFVRQKLAKVAFLTSHPASQSKWQQLTIEDPSSKVRAAALLCPAEVELSSTRRIEALKQIGRSLESESDSFVLRTAMHVAVVLLDQVINQDSESSESSATSELPESRGSLPALELVFDQTLLPALADLEAGHEEIPVRRWAAQTREKIWALLDPQANELIQRLRSKLYDTRIGRGCRIPKQWTQGIGNSRLGRILAVLSQDDFGYDFHRGIFSNRLVRGPVFGFRFWRLFFEARNLATDKRQGLSHTVGRISNATLRAPSQILGELSETKVPGEPLTIASEGGWRPYLPLMDDMVSVLNLSWARSRTVRFYTSQGVTTVKGPKWIWQRIRAAYHLSFRFKKYCDLRNWDDSSFPASEYVQSLRKIGFRIQFESYDQLVAPRKNSAARTDNDSSEPPRPTDAAATDSSITQFFTALALAVPVSIPAFTFSMPLLGEAGFWAPFYRFTDYFGSAFENTLAELLIFALLVMLFVMGKHFLANYKFRTARRKIPLSIGGWGTRGKSGTERLKAALLGVMGHGLVSKTTGCEAMFIHAYAYGDPIEVPFFRPYDKATIWEQSNLVRLAAKMDPSVFLWECMALNPSFVDVLQRQWMQDDLATITNTYPDHEDVQGPAGYNVAETISCFVPLDSELISTEQVMRPYITEKCRLANTRFNGVGWLESGLITDDILARFPYQEHPDNIAMVAVMAMKLGTDYEFALKAVADYLVPDLGVLKTHPVSTVRTRKIEFTNGCSANERFGCMGNWKRLAFDQQDPWTDPCVWVSGVVNNRADRVPRSKVFAKIIVEDINADRFFLIGNNLSGLQSFIQTAWNEHAAQYSLCDMGESWDTDFALTAFEKHAWNMRQPTQLDHVHKKIASMVAAVTEQESNSQIDIQSLLQQTGDLQAIQTALESALQNAGVEESLIKVILKHTAEFTTALQEYQAMRDKIQATNSSNADQRENEFRDLMATWYFRKIVVVPDYFATGEDVVRTIVDETPPGFMNRVMGLQNIKGTGLDFVYRFQAWDTCKEACDAAQSKQLTNIEKGLQTLIAMPVIGQLCQEEVRETIQTCHKSSLTKKLTPLINQLEQKLNDAIATSNPSGPATDTQSKSNSALNDWLINAAEQMLDTNDSVRRRDKADRIYRDLADMRISRQKAIVEIRKINKRQKGGWLKAGLAPKKAA